MRDSIVLLFVLVVLAAIIGIEKPAEARKRTSELSHEMSALCRFCCKRRRLLTPLLAEASFELVTCRAKRAAQPCGTSEALSSSPWDKHFWPVGTGRSRCCRAQGRERWSSPSRGD